MAMAAASAARPPRKEGFGFDPDCELLRAIGLEEDKETTTAPPAPSTSPTTSSLVIGLLVIRDQAATHKGVLVTKRSEWVSVVREREATQSPKWRERQMPAINNHPIVSTRVILFLSSPVTDCHWTAARTRRMREVT